MAVTKLLRIKETKGSNPAAHLKKNIFYICDPAKTEGGLYIGGNAGFSPEMIYAAFIQNKQDWGKETNALKNCTQGFHYMLSFPPDSGINESLAYEITQEFCKQLLGDRHYYVFAVHNDKAHMHTHITFDSVSKEDGYMFHSPKKDWEKRLQPITDSLCEKYHLPTLQYDPSGDRRGKNYGAWDHERQAAQEHKKQKTQKGTMRSADKDTMAGRIPESEVSRPAYTIKDFIVTPVIPVICSPPLWYIPFSATNSPRAFFLILHSIIFIPFFIILYYSSSLVQLLFSSSCLISASEKFVQTARWRFRLFNHLFFIFPDLFHCEPFGFFAIWETVP